MLFLWNRMSFAVEIPSYPHSKYCAMHFQDITFQTWSLPMISTEESIRFSIAVQPKETRNNTDTLKSETQCFFCDQVRIRICIYLFYWNLGTSTTWSRASSLTGIKGFIHRTKTILLNSIYRHHISNNEVCHCHRQFSLFFWIVTCLLETMLKCWLFVSLRFNLMQWLCFLNISKLTVLV